MESHRHQSAASLTPLVIAGGRIIRTAEAQARVEDVDAGAWVEQGTSDVEMGHRLIFVVFSDRGECCWHLECRTKSMHIWAPGQWSLTSRFLITLRMSSKAKIFSQ